LQGWNGVQGCEMYSVFSFTEDRIKLWEWEEGRRNVQDGGAV